MQTKIFFMASMLIVFAAGCARMQFTQQLREDYQLTPELLKKTQMYTSGPIYLERRVARKEAAVDERRTLKLRDTELIRKVVIPRGTPGVVVDANDEQLSVSFEAGSFLVFGSTSKLRGKLGGLYNLMANSWSNGSGVLKYGGETYTLMPGSGSVHLLVNARDFEKTKVVRKRLNGLRVDVEYSATDELEADAVEMQD